MRTLLLLAVVACRDAPAKKAELVLAIDVVYAGASAEVIEQTIALPFEQAAHRLDRKSTRLNSSHSQISYAVFCLKKKKRQIKNNTNINNQKTHCPLYPNLHSNIQLVTLIYLTICSVTSPLHSPSSPCKSPTPSFN